MEQGVVIICWGCGYHSSFGAKNNDLLEAFVFIDLFERFSWLG
jgi:hypothetical protein